jgi:hypothetical protein
MTDHRHCRFHACPAARQVGTPAFNGPEGNTVIDLHSFTFDNYSFGARMLNVLDCGAGAHRLAKDPRNTKISALVEKALCQGRSASL